MANLGRNVLDIAYAPIPIAVLASLVAMFGASELSISPNRILIVPG